MIYQGRTEADNVGSKPKLKSKVGTKLAWMGCIGHQLIYTSRTPAPPQCVPLPMLPSLYHTSPPESSILVSPLSHALQLPLSSCTPSPSTSLCSSFVLAHQDREGFLVASSISLT